MTRSSHLLVSQMIRLRSWGRDLHLAFGEMPYLVGSALERADFRDVDIRLPAFDFFSVDSPDRTFAILPTYLNLAVSLWGQAATGLPIDFQIQGRVEWRANDGAKRQPIGLDPRNAAKSAIEGWNLHSLCDSHLLNFLEISR